MIGNSQQKYRSGVIQPDIDDSQPPPKTKNMVRVTKPAIRPASFFNASKTDHEYALFIFVPFSSPASTKKSNVNKDVRRVGGVSLLNLSFKVDDIRWRWCVFLCFHRHPASTMSRSGTVAESRISYLLCPESGRGIKRMFDFWRTCYCRWVRGVDSCALRGVLAFPRGVGCCR